MTEKCCQSEWKMPLQKLLHPPRQPRRGGAVVSSHKEVISSGGCYQTLLEIQQNLLFKQIINNLESPSFSVSVVTILHTTVIIQGFSTYCLTEPISPLKLIVSPSPLTPKEEYPKMMVRKQRISKESMRAQQSAAPRETSGFSSRAMNFLTGFTISLLKEEDVYMCVTMCVC